MTITDLIPWKQKDDPLIIRKENISSLSLQDEFDRMLENLFVDGWNLNPFEMNNVNRSGFTPQLDIHESDKDYQVSIELPGMNEKDIQVNLSDKCLTISGEKKSETKDKKNGFYRSERSFGRFQRQIRLTSDVNEKEVAAVFKNGVLRITLPKMETYEASARKITIKKG
jgi:HSP20 family protein